MKQSEAAAFWPLIKAWSEGKTLQISRGGTNGVWDDLDFAPNFNSPPEAYRIKPEPIVRYATMYDNMRSVGGSYATEAQAVQWVKAVGADGKVVRLVQDLDYVPPTS